MKRVKILIPVISAFILSCICFFIFYLINNTDFQKNLIDALLIGVVVFVLVFAIFNLQQIRDLPYSQAFLNLYFPLFATGFLALIILSILKKHTDNIIEEQFLTLFLVLLGGVIIYFLQERFYSYAFTSSLSTFIKVSSQKHPVTQKFAADLLLRYLNGNDIEKLKEIFINSNYRTNNIRELIDRLETSSKDSGGLYLSKSDYSSLLTLSLGFNPPRIRAMWDTEMISIKEVVKDHKYYSYFTELEKIYKKTMLKNIVLEYLFLKIKLNMKIIILILIGNK